ncbi:hypothetical protein GCM10027175_11650 [Hymenobacter latericoloratus]
MTGALATRNRWEVPSGKGNDTTVAEPAALVPRATGALLNALRRAGSRNVTDRKYVSGGADFRAAAGSVGASAQSTCCATAAEPETARRAVKAALLR